MEQQIPEESMNELLFLQIVSMFQSQAMMSLGKLMNPVTNKIERDLQQAKFFIDTIGMLDTKTKGNLNENEKKYIEHILFELRMNYIDEMKKEPTPSEQSQTQEQSPSENK